MTKIAAFKFAAQFIVGAGTTTITNSIIRNNVEPTNLFQQISVGAASLVVGSMASSATRSHTVATIDSLAEQWKNHQTKDEPVTA